MTSYYGDVVVECETVDVVKRLYRKYAQTVSDAEARANGKPLELTEDERSAAAFLAGVPIESSVYEDGKLTMTTRPCAVAYDGREWHVFTKPE